MIVREQTPLEGIDSLMSRGDLSDLAYMGDLSDLTYMGGLSDLAYMGDLSDRVYRDGMGNQYFYVGGMGGLGDQYLYMGDMSDLGISFFRRLFRVLNAPFRLVEKVIKKIPGLRNLYALQQRISHKVLRVVIKAAPWLAIAAQGLNFIIPGLGVIVSLAITSASSAYQVTELVKAKARAKKMTAAEQAKADAEIAQSNAKADKALMDSYDKGAPFFQKNYKMSRAEFKAKPMDERIRFLNLVIFDQHAAQMAVLGYKRDDFVKKSIGDQSDALAKMTSQMPGVPQYTTPPEEVEPPPPPGTPPGTLPGEPSGEPSAVLLTQSEEDDNIVPGLTPLEWTLTISGLVGGIALTAYLIKKRRQQ